MKACGTKPSSMGDCSTPGKPDLLSVETQAGAGYFDRRQIGMGETLDPAALDELLHHELSNFVRGDRSRGQSMLEGGTTKSP